MLALWAASAALAGACLTAAVGWALWRRAAARHHAERAERALEQIAARAERQQAHRALRTLARLTRTAPGPHPDEHLDLLLWAWESGADDD